MTIKIDLRTDWERLFDILQVLNPESDKCLYDSSDLENFPDLQTEWEDICYYMSVIKPEENK